MSSAQTGEGLRDAFLDVLSIDPEGGALAVVLASATDSDVLPRFRLLQVTIDLAAEFREVIEQLRRNLIKESQTRDLVVHPYDAGSKPDQHEVEHIDMKEFPEVGAQLEPLSSLANLSLFSSSERDFLQGLRFYAVVVEPKMGEPVIFLRTYTSKRELSRSNWFGALFADGQFDRVRTPVFLFDQKIDCFSRGTDMFILSKFGFQQIFRFYVMIARAARESLQKIKAAVPIVNFEEFQASCEGHLQKQAKLRNIATKDYIDRISMDKIKATIAHYKLKVTVVQKNGQEMLVFDPSDRWAILRLLDDDYLKSLMTDHDYEVTGKRVLA